MYNGDTLTTNSLDHFLQAWNDYRMQYGQKNLVAAFIDQIIITLAFKSLPDLSEEPVHLFRRNFIGPEACFVQTVA